MTKFDPTKPVQTRDGQPARIICTDAEGLNDGPEFTVLAIVNGDVGTYTARGRYYSNREDDSDLVNVPERVTRYFLLSSDEGYMMHEGMSFVTERQARNCNAHGIIAVTFEDGKAVSAEVLRAK